MARYTFDFISNYDGVSHYRIYRDGNDGGRMCVKDNTCYYIDGSGAYKPELDAFNDWMKNAHDAAVERYGVEHVGEWVPYVSA